VTDQINPVELGLASLSVEELPIGEMNRYHAVVSSPNEERGSKGVAK